MDLDTSYIEPLIDDWVEHLQEIVEQQKQERIKIKDFIIPFIAISAPTMKTAFVIADYLELETHVKYMAIHLYDVFMCKRFLEIYKAASPLCETAWFKMCKKYSKHSKLYLMSCFQLACKMDSHCANLGILQILNVLHKLSKKSEYTQKMIFDSEIEVFKTVDYKMPLNTPLHCIEILLAATGLQKTQGSIYIATNLLNLTYLKYDKLFSKFYKFYKDKQEDNLKTRQKLISLKSNMVFLSAAIVLCTMYFVCLDTDILNKKVFIVKLSELSGTNISDIINMSNVLLCTAIQQ
ncbi:cyclin N-terminal domain-containing protein 1-like [Linepithema humile]|uniref:cyclin N-terminal domain-containing protein 1-like n=1 Tax=Linepithema humile TaxID=83485 RepID=UPI00062373AE|nr:PREDICTED: uncharacterized protein LOC105668972 isoform X2 [Linepithema humile]